MPDGLIVIVHLESTGPSYLAGVVKAFLGDGMSRFGGMVLQAPASVSIQLGPALHYFLARMGVERGACRNARSYAISGYIESGSLTIIESS